VNVTVSEHYVVDCETCCIEVETIVRAAIRDMSVSKLTLIPGHRHNHDVGEAGGGKRISTTVDAAPPPSPPSGELFVVQSGAQPGAEINGFDHAKEG
jgi:hypothetical protein